MVIRSVSVAVERTGLSAKVRRGWWVFTAAPLDPPYVPDVNVILAGVWQVSHRVRRQSRRGWQAGCLPHFALVLRLPIDFQKCR